MSTTTDATDPRLGYGVDDKPGPQNDVYLVLSAADRAQGFMRPLRRTYVHTACGTATTVGLSIAETFARNPKFYGSTYCVGCRMHLPVSEFMWDGTLSRVGS